MMPNPRDHYEVRESVDQQFYWVLVAGNGEVLATSETYTRKRDAQRGVTAARKAAKQALAGTVVTESNTEAL